MSKKWFVKFPTHQYKEDVKALAKEHRLRIIDSRFDDGSGVDGPKLTSKNAPVKPETAPVKRRRTRKTKSE